MKKIKVLFIFSRHSRDPNDATLTKDLADEFVEQGCDTYIATMDESTNSIACENGCTVLRICVGNYFGAKRFEKFITISMMPNRFLSAIMEHFSDIGFDLIIAHTPFVSNSRLMVPLKLHFKCPMHLLLWDIFPQNAVDLGLITNSLLISYFRYRERKMFSTFDVIWCMSEGNIKYLTKHYQFLHPDRIKLLYHYSKYTAFPEIDVVTIRRQYGYSSDDIIAIFGGNIGLPQKFENILVLAERCLALEKAKFLVIGNGTEFIRCEKLALQRKIVNIKFIQQINRNDYQKVVAACDIGLVSLDERFTVPNFPSKTIDYFKLKLPILASLDQCAADDYGVFLENKAQAGLFALAGQHEVLYNKFLELYNSLERRTMFGNNGRIFYENYLNTSVAYSKIISMYDSKNNDTSM